MIQSFKETVEKNLVRLPGKIAQQSGCEVRGPETQEKARCGGALVIQTGEADRTASVTLPDEFWVSERSCLRKAESATGKTQVTLWPQAWACAHTHTQAISVSLSIREMWIKTTLRYYLTPVRMTIINISDNKYWKGFVEKWTLIYCWGANLYSHCENRFGDVSKS